MAAVFLTASVSCTPDSLTGVPAQDASAQAATQASAQPITASPSLLGGLLGTLGGTIDAVNGTVSSTIGDVPIVTPLLSTVSGLLVTCEPQRYASTTKWVGPRGGTLYVGPHKLVIPRGALKTYVQITAEAPSDTVVSVRFQPEGLQFDKDHPARLTLDYNACEVSSQQLPSRIAYTDESLNIIEFLSGTVVDKRDRTVTADVKHFSRYAVSF